MNKTSGGSSGATNESSFTKSLVQDASFRIYKARYVKESVG